MAGDVHSSEQSAQMAYFAQVSWCDGKTTFGLQAACLGMRFCPSISKFTQIVTFPSGRLIER